MKHSKVIAPPPQELLEVCEKIGEAAGLVLHDVLETFEHSGHYESDTEAAIQFFVLLRHVEALLECARSDLVLLPAGSTIARAVLEQGAKIRWLLHPSDVFAREARFLAHLSDEERMCARCAKSLGEQTFGGWAAQIREFRLAVQAKLPDHVSPLSGIPTFEVMLNEIGESKKYAMYTLLSQFSHGSHFGGSVYRRHLGSAKEFGEHVSRSQWAHLLKVSWWSLFTAGETIERICAGRALRSIQPSQIGEIEEQLLRLRGDAG